MSTWAMRVAELRSKKGLTFSEIGARIGLSPTAVSDIEHGYTKEPRGAAAIALDALHRSECGETSAPSTVASRKRA